jgi:hypothetical protein
MCEVNEISPGDSGWGTVIFERNRLPNCAFESFAHRLVILHPILLLTF